MNRVCFQAMFSLCMVESEAEEVTLQGVTSEGLKQALDFAYTGQVSAALLTLRGRLTNQLKANACGP